MSDDKLREAFEVMKAGDKQIARRLVREVLKADGKNDRAWWLMVHLLDDEDKKRKAAEKVLEINPAHVGALRLLEREEELDILAKKKRGEYDWSKLDKRRREGYKDKPNGVSSRVVGFITGIILFFLIPAIIHAIVNEAPVLEITGPSPEEVVMTQLEAAFNGDMDTMRDLTCDSLEDEWIRSYQQRQATAREYGDGSYSYDLSNMQAQIIKDSARHKHVEVTGELTIITRSGNRATQDVSDIMIAEPGRRGRMVMSVKVQEQKWVVCSALLYSPNE